MKGLLNNMWIAGMFSWAMVGGVVSFFLAMIFTVLYVFAPSLITSLPLVPVGLLSVTSLSTFLIGLAAFFMLLTLTFAFSYLVDLVSGKFVTRQPELRVSVAVGGVFLVLSVLTGGLANIGGLVVGLLLLFVVLIPTVWILKKGYPKGLPRMS